MFNKYYNKPLPATHVGVGIDTTLVAFSEKYNILSHQDQQSIKTPSKIAITFQDNQSHASSKKQ